MSFPTERKARKKAKSSKKCNVTVRLLANNQSTNFDPTVVGLEQEELRVLR